MTIYLRLTTFVFLVIAVAHTLRIVWDKAITIDTWVLPMEASWAAAAVAYTLFVFALGLCLRSKCKVKEMSALIALLKTQKNEEAALIAALKKNSIPE